MQAFRTSMGTVSLPHVEQYYNCVVGEGMMLPDCTMMAPVKNSDIMKFLRSSGAEHMKHIVEISANNKDAKRFAHYFKTVQKVVCDKSVYEAVNGIVHNKAKEMTTDDTSVMEDMKGIKQMKIVYTKVMQDMQDTKTDRM